MRDLTPYIVAIFLVFPHVLFMFLKIYHPKNQFQRSRCIKDLKFLSQDRLFGSKNYNNTYEYIRNEFNSFSKFASPLFKAEYLVEQGIPIDFNEPGYHHYQGILKNEAILISPIHEAKADPILLSAHVDSPMPAIDSFDDGINVAILLEIARTIILNQIPLKVPIRFVFIGSGEPFLDSYKQLIQHNRFESYNYLILETTGHSIPFAMLTNNYQNPIVQRTWAKVRFSFSATLGNELFKSGIVKTLSPYLQYESAGWKGGSLFPIGALTNSNSNLVTSISRRDLEYQGSMLLAFLSKYVPGPNEMKNQKSQDKISIFGISPFLIIANHRHVMYFGYLCCVAGISIFLKHILSELKSFCYVTMRIALASIVIFFSAHIGLVYNQVPISETNLILGDIGFALLLNGIWTFRYLLIPLILLVILAESILVFFIIKIELVLPFIGALFITNLLGIYLIYYPAKIHSSTKFWLAFIRQIFLSFIFFILWKLPYDEPYKEIRVILVAWQWLSSAISFQFLNLNHNALNGQNPMNFVIGMFALIFLFVKPDFDSYDIYDRSL